ncbi:hypothetical protein OUZ56_010723 [Daphnia magna]|uniref:Uncharacterized protein n=1 Tax=Daphnia magna TaxID=35525 RepID=A0ABQ9YYK4_9CRUS|nr:hypothetical protein OUZ56_010723 [Daphnia magna]
METSDGHVLVAFIASNELDEFLCLLTANVKNTKKNWADGLLAGDNRVANEDIRSLNITCLSPLKWKTRRLEGYRHVIIQEIFHYLVHILPF